METRIILVSHALTQWNVEGRIQGHTDVPLNPAGLEMADMLAERIMDIKIHAIYTSDLKRAYETALPAATLKQIEIIRDIRLREGRSIHQERSATYPTLPFPVDREVEEDLLERMSEALLDIAQRHGGETVLVISHGGAIEIVLKNMLEEGGTAPSAYKGIRMALNTITYRTGKWGCQRLNDAAHLSERIYS